VHAPDEDVRLMLAFCDGDAAAFETLFRRWAGPLLRYLERMLGEAGAAEELVQEAFLRVHRARASYRPDARFSSWLYRIGTNLALNELRRPARRAPHGSVEGAEGEGEPLPAAPESTSEDLVDARREVRALDRALRELPERQRAALWLVAVEGHSYAEVAGSLEISEAAVKALVHRARTSLAAQLAAQVAGGPRKEAS
jgi:RNA polymerase sigma-70 factor, ECF subfamily